MCLAAKPENKQMPCNGVSCQAHVPFRHRGNISDGLRQQPSELVVSVAVTIIVAGTDRFFLVASFLLLPGTFFVRVSALSARFSFVRVLGFLFLSALLVVRAVAASVARAVSSLAP